MYVCVDELDDDDIPELKYLINITQTADSVAPTTFTANRIVPDTAKLMEGTEELIKISINGEAGALYPLLNSTGAISILFP